MTVKERLKKFISYLGISVSKFEKTIGASNGYVNSISKSIGIDKINVMLEKFPNLNIEWLLTGRGEMLRNAPTAGGHLEQPAGKMELLARQMELLEQERELLREQVRFLREKLNWAEKQVQELEQSVVEKEKHIRQCRELTKKPGDAVDNKPEKLK